MRYTVRLESPTMRRVGVTLDIDRPDPGGQILRLPAWIPGSYMIRDFARHVLGVAAQDGDGVGLAVHKLDKDTWRCAPASGPLRVSWQVHCADGSVRAAILDSSGGFFNGTSVFLQPVELPDGPFEVVIEPPDPPFAQWRLATAMEAVATDPAGFGRYRAADYEDLVDHPVMFGDLQVYEFDVRGVPHRLVLSTPERIDHQRICSDLQRICEQHVAMFGELPVQRAYLFLCHVVATGYGGLEHRDSTLLEVARDALPQPGDEPGRAAYRQLLGLCSHEYFHLWHGKRIRPAAFTPLDLSREAPTTLLWAVEGMTSYYDDLGLLRAGVIGVDDWLGEMGRTISRVYRGRGRHLQSIAESSFDAWTRFYKADENAPNAIVSYYAKGALVALCLDLLIRRQTEGACSLDDVMRRLWQNHGRTGDGVPEDGVAAIVAEIGGDALSEFLVRGVHGREDPDLAGALAEYGISLQWARTEPTATWSPELGATLAGEGGLVRLTQVLEGRPASRAGLCPGDRIVALDAIQPGFEQWTSWLARLPHGEALAVHYLRDGRLASTTVALDEAPAEQALLRLDDTAADGARERRAQWIGV